MAPVFSKPQIEAFTRGYSRHRPMIQRVLNIAFATWTVGGTYLALQAKPSKGSSQGRTKSKSKEHGEAEASSDTVPSTKGKAGDKPKRVQIDAVFYARLRKILRIVIPGIRSKEAMLLIMHSCLLVFRTAISIYVANLDGK